MFVVAHPGMLVKKLQSLQVLQHLLERLLVCLLAKHMMILVSSPQLQCAWCWTLFCPGKGAQVLSGKTSLGRELTPIID